MPRARTWSITVAALVGASIASLVVVVAARGELGSDRLVGPADGSVDRRLRHLAEATVGTDEELAQELEGFAEHLPDHGDAAGAMVALHRCAGLTPLGHSGPSRRDASSGGVRDCVPP